MKRILNKTLKILIIFYLVICTVLYFFQEKILFFPQKLPSTYQYHFKEPFEEINLKNGEGNLLNGLLFKSKNSRGLVFFLHGNAGALNSWGQLAKYYTDLHYDIFMLDYQGFGKSDGEITSQYELFADNQLFYNEMLKKYDEKSIIVLGYSLGTGLASKIAADNHPGQLVLLAPYYSLKDVMKYSYPMIPTFLLKYKIETYKYLELCNMPITIFHGKQDEIIYFGSGLKLKEKYPDKIDFIPLENQGHNNIMYNFVYKKYFKQLLSTYHDVNDISIAIFPN